MTEKTVEVGDPVPWPLVPDGALVQAAGGFCYLRIGEHGSCVGVTSPRGHWSTFRGEWDWSNAADDEEEFVTIAALDVPADATAEDLRALAERFEVREVLEASGIAGIAAAAEAMHAAGWRRVGNEASE